MSPDQQRRKRKGGDSPLTKGLMVIFGLSIVLGIASFLLSQKPLPDGAEALRLGMAALHGGRPREAEAFFQAAAGDENPKISSAAYHNLALLALQEALASQNPRTHPATDDAIRMSDSSLVLVAGAEETAWNLEIALSLLRDQGSSPPPEKDQSQGQQKDPGAADTRDEEIHDGGASHAGDPSQSGGLSEEEARRLLASFRLMEKDKSREALKAMLRAEPGATSFRRRGPPW